MSKLPLLALLAATAAAAMLFQAWDGYATSSPEQLLEEAQVLADAEPPQMGLAQRKLQRALSLEPNEATRIAITQERADLYLRDRSHELALREFKILLEHSPDDIDLLNQLATIAEALHDRELTVEYLDRMLAVMPTNSWAQAKQARELDHLSVELELRIQEDLLAYLPRSKVDMILPMVQQASYLPLDDPVRIGLIARLQSDLERRSPESLPIAIEGIGELAQIRGRAREAYTTSLGNSINRFNLYGMLSHLRASGRLHDAVDFGLVVPFFEASIEHPGTLQDLALLLESLGRSRLATTTVQNAIAEDATWKNDFLESWCGILYRARLWPQLRNAATQYHRQSGVSAENRSKRGTASFFWGMAQFHLDEFVSAQDHFSRYLSIRPPPPVPDAMAATWLAMADMYLEQGSRGEELKALRKCMEASPRYSADVYVRAAVAVRRNDERGITEAKYLAHAISIDASLEAELLPLFEDAGERGAAATRLKLLDLALELRLDDRWYPSGDPAPYVLWKLAHIHLEQGQQPGALVTLQRLRKSVEGFAPAFRLESSILQQQGRTKDQINSLLEGVAWNGPDPVSISHMKAILAGADEGQLEGATLRRWMELDPSFAGAIEVAKELHRLDRTEEALLAISGTDRSLFTDADNILYGEVLTSLNLYGQVLATTADIDPTSPAAGTAALIRARAAVFLNQGEILEQSLTLLETYDPVLDEKLTQDVLGLMNAGGLEPQAMRLALHLASSPKTRSGSNLNLAAATAALSGDLENARAWVELSNAFLTDMSPTAGLLLINIQAGTVDDLPSLARQLRNEPQDWSGPAQPALLAALEGRLGEARALLLAELELSPFDPSLHLLGAALNSLGAVPIGSVILGVGLGAPGGPPLARISKLPKAAGMELLGMLLAKDVPGWDAWAYGRLSRQAHRVLLGPYGREMLARNTMKSGEYELARNMAELSIKRWKDFVPFWDLLEELAILEYGANSPKVVTAKLRRRHAGIPVRGGSEPTQIELLLDAATLASAKGDTQEALDLARQAQTLDGSSLPVRLAVARFARPIEPLAALNGYKGYLLVATGPEVPEAIEEMFALFAMRAGQNPDAKEINVQRLLLENLQLKRPDDPLPIIELARLDILEAESMPAVTESEPSAETPGVQSALERMERFFRSHRDTSLEQLRPGSCAAWFELLSAFDPMAALAFADGQLDLSPRSLDLWILHARGLQATAQMDLALEAWLRIGQMTAAPEVALATANLMSELGGGLAKIEGLLELAKQAEDPRRFRRRTAYIRARSHIQLGGKSLLTGVDILETLTLTEPASPEDVTDEELDYTLAIGLLLRAQVGDGGRAAELLMALAETEEDPLRAQLLRGLAGLGRSLNIEIARHEKARAAARAKAEEAALAREAADA